MARNPLKEDGRRYRVDESVDWEYSRMGWDESFTQGLTICAKEYGDWRMVDVGRCPGLCRFHGSCFLHIWVGKNPSFCFDGGDHFKLEWGSSSDNCCCTPISCLSTSGSIGVENIISLIWSNVGEATLAS